MDRVLLCYDAYLNAFDAWKGLAANPEAKLPCALNWDIVLFDLNQLDEPATDTTLTPSSVVLPQARFTPSPLSETPTLPVQ